MKKISNYHELAAEKQRLQQQLSLLKRDVESEIAEIKEKFRPITKIIGLLGGGNGNSTSSNGSTKSTLLKAGGNLAVDLLIGPKLAKAGMITRMIVPPLLRGIATGIINRFRKKK